MEEANGNRLHPRPGDFFRNRRGLRVIERCPGISVRAETFLDLEGEMSRNERFRPFEEDVVSLRSIAASDLVQVARPLRDYQRGTNTFALDDSVDGRTASVAQASLDGQNKTVCQPRLVGRFVVSERVKFVVVSSAVLHAVHGLVGIADQRVEIQPICRI